MAPLENRNCSKLRTILKSPVGPRARSDGPNSELPIDDLMMSHHIEKTSPEEILRMARTAGQLRRFRTAEPHVRQRMAQRGATIKCLARALQTATAATHQAENDRWRLEGGVDSDGDELTLVVALRDGVVIVTLF